MKVKTGELKTHLSRYLRHVRETGEEIEVCIRETPVAYLTRAKENRKDTARQEQQRQLESAFKTAGLTLVVSPTLDAGGTSRSRSRARPSVAGDGRTDLDSVATMRSQREW